MVVFLALVVVLVISGARFFQFAKGLVEEDWMREGWVAPSPAATGDALFPAMMEEARRQSTEAVSGLALLGIGRPGELGAYRLADGRSMAVYAWQVNADEAGEMLDAIGRAIDEGPYSMRSKFTMSRASMRFSFSPPHTAGRAWFNKGWLFLFLSPDGVELDTYEVIFLDAVEGAGGQVPLLPEADVSNDEQQ